MSDRIVQILTEAEADSTEDDEITIPDDVKEIGDNDPLPNQGNVTSVPDTPPVESGKQGKHVIGHNNYDPSKTS